MALDLRTVLEILRFHGPILLQLARSLLASASLALIAPLFTEAHGENT